MPDHCTSCCPLLAPPPKPPGWPILLEGQRRLGAPRRRMAPREPSFGIREDLLPLVFTPQHQAEPSRSPSGRPWLREGCAEEGPFAWSFPAAPTGLSVYLPLPAFPRGDIPPPASHAFPPSADTGLTQGLAWTPPRCLWERPENGTLAPASCLKGWTRKAAASPVCQLSLGRLRCFQGFPREGGWQ